MSANVPPSGSGEVAVALEAPADAAKLGQRLHDGRVGRADLHADGDRGERVLHVVHAGQIEGDRQIRPFAHAARCRLAHDAKAHAPAVVANIDGADLRRVAQAVGDDRLRDDRQDRAHVRIVHAQHRHAVEGQALEEIDERLPQAREIVAVGLHVIGIDVRDHRQHRLQVQERRVGLVGFDDDELAAAELGVGAGAPRAARRSRRSDPCRPPPARSRSGSSSWSCRGCRRSRCPA